MTVFERGAKLGRGLLSLPMDLHATLEEVARWCAQQTAAGDPESVEVDSHGMVCITIGESAPPWHARWERRSSAGAGSPVAQLRYDLERREWSLHHPDTGDGWCAHDDAIQASEVGPLLDVIAGDRMGRFRGLGPSYTWPWDG